MLDIKLDTLLALYEEKSFTKAAKRLNLTQPAVSNHIHMLENEIGNPLCSHAKGTLTFTPKGEIVVNYARRFKTLYDNMCQEIMEKQTAFTQIKIGVTKAIESYHFITYAIGQYMTHHTNSNLKILSDATNNLYNMLINYEVDFIITDSLPENNLKFTFASILLDSDPLACFVSSQNPLSQKKLIHLEEIKTLPLIMYFPSAHYRNIFISALEESNESIDHFNIIMEIDNLTTVDLMVKNDIGISILPQKLSSTSTRYQSIPIMGINATQDIHLIHRKDFFFTNIISDFLSMYKEVSSI